MIPKSMGRYILNLLACFIVIILIFWWVIHNSKGREVIRDYSTEPPAEFPVGSATEGIIIMNKDTPFIVIDRAFAKKDIDMPIKNLIAKYEGTGKLWIEQKNLDGELQTGQKVRFWYNQVLESYPPVYRVVKLEIL